MNRSKREDYKRFVVFCLASLIVIAQAAIFAYVWYDFYSDLILKPFWRKGNWVMILIYALIYLMFAKLYGGLKVGYLKRIDVFYSLTLATICTNVVTYFQITLINRWFMSVRPVIEMTGVQLIVTVLWIWGSRYIYSRLYGARRLLVLYGDRDPGDVIHKMNTRKDKYDISGKVHIREGEEKIHAMMEDYEGVIIWDLPSQIRNRYLKYCFSHSIRCYMSATGKPVACICGDGAFQMNIQELQWVKRENIPVKMIVMNNEALGMIRHLQRDYFDCVYADTSDGSGFSSCDFTDVAQAYGIPAKRIQGEDVEKYAGGFLEQNGPELLEIMLEHGTYAYPKTCLGEPIHNQQPYIPKPIFDELMEL